MDKDECWTWTPNGPCHHKANAWYIIVNKIRGACAGHRPKRFVYFDSYEAAELELISRKLYG